MPPVSYENLEQEWESFKKMTHQLKTSAISVKEQIESVAISSDYC